MGGGLNTEEDKKEFAEMVANACAGVLRKEREKMSWKAVREREAKERLKSYRRLKKKYSDDAAPPSEDEQAELRWKCLEDLIGKPDSFLDKTIQSIGNRERIIRQTEYSLWQVETAMRLYAQECERFGTDEDKRRYRVICSMYIDPNRKSVEQIAEEECINTRTVYKDIDAACAILAVYMFGF